MIFLAILIALLLERVLWNPDPYRTHQWFYTYCDRLIQSTIGGWLVHQPLGAAFLLLPIGLLVAWLQGLLGSNGILGLAFGVLILLFSLGPRDLGRDTDAYLKQKDRGEEKSFEEATDRLCGQEIAMEEPLRSLSVARCILAEANTRITGVLFWFLLLGPLGAFIFRLTHQLRSWQPEQENIPETLANSVTKLCFLMDWLPARLTAISYAVAGNFEGVAQVWKNLHRYDEDQQKDEAALLLESAGAAALDSYPHESDLEDMPESPPVVEDALALVWRALSLWVISIAIGSLIAAMS